MLAERKSTLARACRYAPALSAAVVVAVFLGICSQFYLPGRGFSALVMFGSHHHDRMLPQVRALQPYEIPDSFGYDGQYYAQLAVQPRLDAPELAIAIDNPPYRARRMLFSWTAWGLALGDPARALQIYAVQNIACWLALAVLLLRWLPLWSWGNFARWFGIVGSFGWALSVRGALVDGPSVLLLASGVTLLESGHRWWAAGVLGFAGLGKETNLLGAAALAPPAGASRREWLHALGQVALVALPLAVWFAVLVQWLGTSGVGGARNFAPPLMAFANKVSGTLSQFFAEAWRSEAKWELLSLIALTTQGMFFALHRRWNESWWRIGAVYAALMTVLGPAVWEGFPGAASRVLLPMTLAFNLLVPRGGGWRVVLVLGNLSVVSSFSLLQLPARIDHEIAGPAALRLTPAGDPAVTVRFEDGWLPAERSFFEYWRWSGGAATIVIINRQSAPLETEVTFALRSNESREVAVRQGGAELWRGRLEAGASRKIRLPQVRLEPGDTVWHLETDSREPSTGGSAQAFSVRDLRLRVLPPAIR